MFKVTVAVALAYCEPGAGRVKSRCHRLKSTGDCPMVSVTGVFASRPVIAIVLMRLILRGADHAAGQHVISRVRRVLGSMAVFPDVTGWVAHVGFSTLANLFFCTAIAALTILHLRALTKSRYPAPIALTQGSRSQERLDRTRALVQAATRTSPETAP
jgi:hypothetical protein